MMMWFGRAHGAPYEADTPHGQTPAGSACGRCGEPIALGDDGFVLPHHSNAHVRQVAYHYACHLRSVCGGLNHLLGRCTCCGGTETPDPPGMTKREAAEAAVKEWLKQVKR